MKLDVPNVLIVLQACATGSPVGPSYIVLQGGKETYKIVFIIIELQ